MQPSGSAVASKQNPRRALKTKAVVAHLGVGGTIAGTAAIFGLPVWSTVEIAVAAARDGKLTIDFDDLRDLTVVEASRRLVQLAAFGESLGVSLAALLIGEVGFYPPWGAFTTPIRDATGRVIGLRTRWSGKKKKSSVYTTNPDGVFATWPVTTGAAPGPVLIAEGDSDWLTGIDLGLPCVGRPNAREGDDVLVEVLRDIASSVVVIADRDPKSDTGIESAHRVADRILADLDRVARIVMVPEPFKDLRAWRNGGATREDVLALVTAPPRKTTRVRIFVGGAL